MLVELNEKELKDIKNALNENSETINEDTSKTAMIMSAARNYVIEEIINLFGEEKARKVMQKNRDLIDQKVDAAVRHLVNTLDIELIGK